MDLNKIREQQEAEKHLQEMQELKAKMENLTVKVAIKVGANGKAFGSISTKEIVDSSFLRNYAMNKKICNNGAGIDTCIEEYIIKTVKSEKNDGKLYITGGTAKTALSLTKTEKKYITVKETGKIIQFIKEKSEEELKQLFNTRYDTIEVGIRIIKTLAEIFGKEEIYVPKSGVREGYLIKKEMNN